MGKKRKASGHAPGARQRKHDADNSKLTIQTYKDVADSEDEFLSHRDKVLLDEGPEAKKRRKWKEQDELLEASDEEVLAYSSPSDDEDLEDKDQDAEEEDAATGKDDVYHTESEAGSGAEDEDLGDWGPSKKEYYGGDVIETEQDARDEEEEARRLQQKHLQGMTEADFGFDEDAWFEDGQTDEVTDGIDDGGDVVTEVLPQLHITEDMSAAERTKLLKARYPEFDPLAKEFLELRTLHEALSFAASTFENISRRKRNGGKTPVAVIKYRTLSAYLAAMSMYFALLTSTSEVNGSGPIAKNPQELRDHPVMDGLVKCRQLWTQVKDLRIPSLNEELDTHLSVIEEEPESKAATSTKDILVSGVAESKASKKPKKTKAQKAAEAAQAEAEARRAERMRKMEEDLTALTSLTDKSARQKALKAKLTSSKPVIIAGDDSDFGDETELTAQEAAEKAKRKKSLRFYTSQITQKANKRGAAGRDTGGDTDLPYRERLKDRIARLNAEAEKRGKRQQADELGGESDEEDRRVAKELRGENNASDEEEGYYDLVAARSKQRKASKQAQAEAYAQAAREGARVIEKEEVGPDGKRAITYMIEKNKGLTPHRKKDVRNPRVKKRKKFEEKKKKLGSIRPVYKGGEGRGGYGGELTGIKKGLVKSVKL